VSLRLSEAGLGVGTMKRTVWITAACLGVSTCVAVSLLMTHKSLDSFVRLLEPNPGFFFPLLLLGAECAMLVNDIAASRGWKGFNETRMYGGLDGGPMGPPVSLRSKLYVVYPFSIGLIVLALTVTVAKY